SGIGALPHFGNPQWARPLMNEVVELDQLRKRRAPGSVSVLPKREERQLIDQLAQRARPFQVAGRLKPLPDPQRFELRLGQAAEEDGVQRLQLAARNRGVLESQDALAQLADLARRVRPLGTPQRAPARQRALVLALAPPLDLLASGLRKRDEVQGALESPGGGEVRRPVLGELH